MDESDFIPTKGSLLKKKALKDFEVVTFNSYKSKKATLNESNLLDSLTINKKDDINNTRPELNIKKARYEIIKFGMSGFDTQKKEEAKVQLAIKLGAKPARNKYKNYKEVLEEKKNEAQRKKSQLALQQIGKNSLGKSIAKGKSFDRKRKMDKNGLLDVYGVVKAKDLQKNEFVKRKRK